MNDNFELTDEQKYIVDDISIDESEIVKVLAFAGTGKTSTLLKAASSIQGNKLYLAFNKSIAEEAKSKFSKSNTEVRTTHALAYAYVVKSRGYMVKNSYSPIELMHRYNCEYWIANKARKIVENFCNSAVDEITLDERDDQTNENNQLSLNVAKQYFQDMLQKNIDITHSGYLKVFEMMLKKQSFTTPKYRLIMLDEAQDTNDVTLSIFYNLNSKQKIVVGDRHQQIYSFRGSINAMKKIDSKTYALTNSFRFTKKIGIKATEFLKHFRDEALTLNGMGKEGNSDEMNEMAYITRSNVRMIHILEEHMLDHKYIKPVRNPDATFGLALNLKRLENNELDQIDREYNYLKKFMDKWNNLSLHKRNEFLSILEYVKSTIKDEEDEVFRTINLLSKIRDIEAVYKYAVTCYHDTKTPQLFATTAHTSKGLEWAQVTVENDFPCWYSIGKWFKKNGISPATTTNPFKYFVKNCKDQKYIDELNLYYVAITRAKYELHDMTEFNKLPTTEKGYDREVIKACLGSTNIPSKKEITQENSFYDSLKKIFGLN